MDKLTIKQVNTLQTEIEIPGSKSITNRALIIGALSDGETILKNVLFSDDTVYMYKALQSLGIEIDADESACEIKIKGRSGEIDVPSEPIFIGNAGTAMRFLTSLVTLGEGDFVLTGDERMQERPIGDLVEGLQNLGADIAYLNNEGFPPIQLYSSGLTGTMTEMKGDVSSQYFSSMLLSAPYAFNDTEIDVIGDLVSKPYIDITINMMKQFGVEVVNEDYQRFVVPCGKVYNHQEYIVEGDASNASYFFGAAAITGGKVKVKNIDMNSSQGDIQFVKILEEMGCSVTSGENYVEVQGAPLKGITIDMKDMSDVVQTLAVVALFAEGKTHIKNVANMRVKETDRLKALYKELTKLGADVVEESDGLIITPKKSYNSAEIETYNDHRMAMSFSLAGLKIDGVTILDPGCVSKTFPHYFELFDKMCES